METKSGEITELTKEITELTKETIEEKEEVETKLTEEVETKLTEELALRIINLTSEKSNLKILRLLPSDEETIKETLDLGDYNYYRKMKRFHKNGLVNLNVETNKEETTDLGKLMIDLTNMVINKMINR